MISNVMFSVTIGYPEHLLQPLHLYNFGKSHVVGKGKLYSKGLCI